MKKKCIKNTFFNIFIQLNLIYLEYYYYFCSEIQNNAQTHD